MGSFRLKRKIFFDPTDPFGGQKLIAAKKAIQVDARKHEGWGPAIKQGFIQTAADAQRYIDRNPNSEHISAIKKLYGKKVTVPSTNASIEMGAPAGPSIGGTGAGVGGF